MATFAVAYLFSPFLYVMLLATVVVIVAWPLFERILDAVHGRRGLAAALTILLLAVVFFVPVSVFVYLFVEQAIALATTGAAYVQSGALAEDLAYLSATRDWMPTWLQRWLPADFDLMQTIAAPLQESVLRILNAIGVGVPSLLGSTMSLGIDLVIFLLTVATLFVEGPRVLRMLANLSPLDDAYEERLYAVFSQFANNVVVGTLATALIQGTVAGVGYAIAGVDQVVFFGMLTGLCSFVPLVGTVIIWVPLAIVTAFEEGLGWGLFIAAWGSVVITQLDNFVRPLFMRGRTNIHPLLLFLGVFGGLAWMGVAGALMGPVIVVFFFAMYTIYVEDFLGLPTPELVPPPQRHWLPRWALGPVRRVRHALEAVGIRRKPHRVRPEDVPTLPRDDPSRATP